jgi:hypothetical protein
MLLTIYEYQNSCLIAYHVESLPECPHIAQPISDMPYVYPVPVILPCWLLPECGECVDIIPALRQIINAPCGESRVNHHIELDDCEIISKSMAANRLF